MTKRPSFVLLLRVGLMIGSAAAASLVFWTQLQNREHVYIRDLTKVLARTIQTGLSDEMSSRILAQERLAKLIEDALPRRNWENQARLFMKRNPGFVAERWMDATYQVCWVGTKGVGDARLRRKLSKWIIRNKMASSRRTVAITGRAASRPIIRYMALGREEES